MPFGQNGDIELSVVRAPNNTQIGIFDLSQLIQYCTVLSDAMHLFPQAFVDLSTLDLCCALAPNSHTRPSQDRPDQTRQAKNPACSLSSL